MGVFSDVVSVRSILLVVPAILVYFLGALSEPWVEASWWVLSWVSWGRGPEHNTKDQNQRGLHLSVWLVEKGLYHTYGQVESKLNGE